MGIKEIFETSFPWIFLLFIILFFIARIQRKKIIDLLIEIRDGIKKLIGGEQENNE